MNSLKNCSDACVSSIRNGQRLSLKVSLCATALIFCGVIIQSCGPSHEQMEARENYLQRSNAIADSVSGYMAGIATDTIAGVTHNFIRTASLKCRMGNVLSATKHIEDLVSASGGFASKSNLSSNSNYSSSIHFKKDSVLEQMYYVTTAYMTLKVPNKQLDSVLRKITDMAVFIDYRTLTSDDVKMKLFANSLAEARLHRYTKRMETTIDTKTTKEKEPKLNHVIAAEENALAKQTQADETQLQSYDLADQVNYSTLTIELYEAQKSFSEKTAVPTVIETYEPPFTEKFSNAFLKGFDVLKTFILFLAESWSVFFILIVMLISAKKAVGFYNKRYAVNAK